MAYILILHNQRFYVQRHLFRFYSFFILLMVTGIFRWHYQCEIDDGRWGTPIRLRLRLAPTTAHPLFSFSVKQIFFFFTFSLLDYYIRESSLKSLCRRENKLCSMQCHDQRWICYRNTPRRRLPPPPRQLDYITRSIIYLLVFFIAFILLFSLSPFFVCYFVAVCLMMRRQMSCNVVVSRHLLLCCSLQHAHTTTNSLFYYRVWTEH